MSTVVYRDGVLAADRQVTDDNRCLGEVRKIFKGKDCLIGTTGAYSDAMAFVKWAEKGFPPKEKPESVRDVEAIVVRRDGSYYVTTAPLWIEEPIGSDFYASGSGSSIAIGALAMGATSVEAVQIAMQYDVYTGKGLDVLTLDDIPKPARRTTAKKARSRRR